MKTHCSSRLVSSRLSKRFSPTVLAGAISLGLLAAYSSLQADATLWSEALPDSVATESARQTPLSSMSSLEKFRALHLDETRLDEQLAVLSAARQTKASVSSGLTLSLPLPDGSFASVELVPDHVLAPELEKEHPELKVWSVVGGDQRIVGGVVDRTPLGLHAMLELRSGDTVFIDPDESVKGSRTYVSFSKRNNPKAFAAAMKGFKCGNKDHDHSEGDLMHKLMATDAQPVAEQGSTRVLGQNLNTYRLALVTTAEFTQLNGGATATLSRLGTLIGRVNVIYRRDASINFNLVGGTKIIQTNLGDGTTVGDGLGDGYSNDTNDTNVILTQNQVALDRLVQNANYDVGHVINTGILGLGQYRTPCVTGSKARGTSSIPRSLANNDAFAAASIDMLAHELGHQFDARHTFNADTGGACDGLDVNGDGVLEEVREPTAAVEPGSGTSIMSYAGQCGSNNVMPQSALANSSEPMFHAHSMQLIAAYAHGATSVGNTCGTRPALINGRTGLPNRNPTVTMPAGVRIPARTPFTLPIATASDLDGDVLSYAWDQMDIGGNPANLNQDRINSALIRSRMPVYGNSARTIPNIVELLANRAANGEFLPSTSRNLNFRLVVRDGMGGSVPGNYRVIVVDTGAAFSVPATTLTAGQPLTVRWNVANTQNAPISCLNVNISVVNSTGIVYANLGNHANNGLATTTTRLPSTLQANSRVKVSCVGNIFFAISGATPRVAAR